MTLTQNVTYENVISNKSDGFQRMAEKGLPGVLQKFPSEKSMVYGFYYTL